MVSGEKKTGLVKAALWYASHGFPVFPLHSAPGGVCSCGDLECQNPGKHPRTAHGFKDATKDQNRIAAWWKRWPDANIGIPTGKSSGLLVLDCDPRNGGPADRSELVERCGPIPDTAEAITGGGGRHLFFRHRGGAVPKTLAPGIDLKGDGGYVVAPPSIHVSGDAYQWDGIAGAKALLSLAEEPAWLLEYITAARGGSRQESKAAPGFGKIPKGKRNDHLASLGGSMRKRGMSRQAIEAALLEENRLQCDPPLPEAEVKRVAASIASYQPADKLPDHSARSEGAGAGSLTTRCLSDVEAKPVCWLWPGRVARGKLTIIAGEPGLGKSQITASIAAVVTQGGRWPVDRQQCKPGRMLFLTAEDDPADTLRPRLEAAGADLSRVHIVDGVTVGYAGDGRRTDRTFSLQADIQALGLKLADLGNVVAVVIDPITAYLGDTDSHKNADVRALLAPLSELAARHDTAIIAVSHLTKAVGAKALMRVTGSLAFVAAARAAYLVTTDPHDKTRRLFLPMKNNLGPDATGLAFHIEGVTISSRAGPLETSRVSWRSEPVPMTADEAMQAESASKSASALDLASDWLRETLASGPVAATDIFDRAKAEGIAKKTVQRASRALGVRKLKEGMAGGWEWSLPPKVAKAAEDAQVSSVATFEETGHLREQETGKGEGEL